MSYEDDSDEDENYHGNYLELERDNGTYMLIPLDWLDQVTKIYEKSLMVFPSSAMH